MNAEPRNAGPATGKPDPIVTPDMPDTLDMSDTLDMPAGRRSAGAYVSRELAVEPESEGRLSGRTFAVKDVFDVAGHTSTAGNPDWHRTHGPAARHARAVRLLVGEGARLLGATVTDELMYSLQGENHHYGTPANPNAEGRVPGGSSSGSASAVAAGDADFALGTDTGGSVRIPASYCGILGFRPGHGAVSAEGVIPLAPSFDTVGWMSRDAGTLADVGSVLLEDGAGPKRETGFSTLLLAAEAWGLADEDIRATLRRELSALAPELEPLPATLPDGDLSLWAKTFRTIQGLEIWEQHGEWIDLAKPRFGPGIAERFRWARTLNVADKSLLYDRKREIARGMEKLLGDDALLVLPTAAGEAPPLRLTGDRVERERARTMMLTCIAGLSGLPQATVPFLSPGGRPIGLSFIAGRNRDQALLDWLRAKFESRGGRAAKS